MNYHLLVFLLGFILGPGLALLTVPVFVYLQKLFYVPLARKRMLRKAIAKGNVVTAKLEKSSDGYDGGEKTIYTHGYYRYEWNGKTYTYWCKTANHLPEEITLYFRKTPRKACLASEFGLSESNWLLSFLIMSIVMCIVVWIAGFTGVGVEWLEAYGKGWDL